MDIAGAPTTYKAHLNVDRSGNAYATYCQNVLKLQARISVIANTAGVAVTGGINGMLAIVI